MPRAPRSQSVSTWLTILLALNTLAIAVAAWQVVAGKATSPTQSPSPAAPELPNLDVSHWRTLPLQDGRTRPFGTFCDDTVRRITGTPRYAGLPAEGLVLAWMFSQGDAPPEFGSEERQLAAWEQAPFILCAHASLRKVLATEETLGLPQTAQRVSPSYLRASPALDNLLKELAQARQAFGRRAHFQLSGAHLQAEEVARRLQLFDALCGRTFTRLHQGALAGGRYFDLPLLVPEAPGGLAEVLHRETRRLPGPADPVRLVALDQAAGAGWFSLNELHWARRAPQRWTEFVRRRAVENPAHYLPFQQQRELDRFRELLAAAHEQEALAQLEASDPRVATLQADIAAWRAAGGNANSPETRALLLDYLAIASSPEDGFAADSLAGQPFPQAETDAVLGAWAKVREAYQRASAADFAQRSQAFFATLRHTAHLAECEGLAQRQPSAELVLAAAAVRTAWKENSAAPAVENAWQNFRTAAAAEGLAASEYPGTTTLATELRLARLRPFRWAAWLMLAAAAAQGIATVLASRWLRAAGLALAVASLVLQGVGFSWRISISGWAPVSNLYETIIFAAFLAGAGSLVLEALWGGKIYAAAGAVAGALGLLLADLLPVALDPAIDPLVPVLRSNYWLTVHVLTIVAGYAAASIAWAAGNIALGLLAFHRSETQHGPRLAKLIYRAFQITVLLLATGTLLGGWWAAHAWGRFWGWDPKEVGALIALLVYVVPLHARYLGYLREFGLAVAGVLCFGGILLSWYVVNFVLAAGLHSYGFSAGGAAPMLLAVLLNLEWLLACCRAYVCENQVPAAAT